MARNAPRKWVLPAFLNVGVAPIGPRGVNALSPVAGGVPLGFMAEPYGSTGRAQTPLTVPAYMVNVSIPPGTIDPFTSEALTPGLTPNSYQGVRGYMPYQTAGGG